MSVISTRKVWLLHVVWFWQARMWLRDCDTHEYDFCSQSVIYTRSMFLTCKNAQEWFLHAECDNHTHGCNYNTYECDYDTHKCDYDTLECDLCTQSAIFTRRVWFLHIRVWFLNAKCDFNSHECDFYTQSGITTCSVISTLRVCFPHAVCFWLAQMW
jgi:hypothetical protein